MTRRVKLESMFGVILKQIKLTKVEKREFFHEYSQKIQQPKMKELWDNTKDEEWNDT